MIEKKALKNKELMQEIIGLCRQYESGTVFIATADNHLARLVLINGEVEFASMHRLKGIDAIRELASLSSGLFGFDPDLQLVTQKQDLPDTESLIQILQSGVAYSRQYGQAKPQQNDEQLLPRVKVMDILVEESTEYLGPMAAIICQDYMQKLTGAINSTDIQQVIRQLEQDINNTEKAQKFRAAVMARISQ